MLRFGIDVSIKQRARRLPAEADVLLRAGAGGEVVDSRTLSLERPNDSLLCG